MNVAEIKAKLPEAEIYELSKDAKYLLVVEADSVSRSTVEAILKFCPIDVMVLRVYGASSAVRLLEVKDGSK